MIAKKKFLWIVVSCLMALSLVIASCGPAEEEAEVEVGEEEVEVGAGEVEVGEEEVVEEEAGLLPPDVPKYGGELVATGGDPMGYDAGTMQNIMITETRIMNEPLLIGDWSKGPAGTGLVDWQLGHMYMTSALRGGLAESYELPDDETIIYHIRPGVQWWDKPPMNGREFTAYDAAWSIEREWACDKCWPRASNPPEDWIISVKALDKYTLEVKVPAHAQGKHIFTNGWEIQMLPPEVIEQYGDMNDWENVVGTGAFMLTDYVVSSSLTYTRNPNYWSNDPVLPENQLPYLDSVKLLIIPDLSSIQAGFRTGKIDMLGGISIEDWERFTETIPDLEYAQTFPWIPTYLCGRMDKDLPFNDLRVRQAMNMAVNQQEILDDYYKGYGTMLAYPFTPAKSFSDVYVPLEEMPAAVQELFEYKPDKAKQLLADAGYPNGFQTVVTCAQREVDLLSIIKEYLLAVNIDMELNVVEGGAHFGMKKGRTFPEMIMCDTYPYGYVKLHNIRPESASCCCSWEGSEESRAAYNEAMMYLGKDDTKVRQAIKAVVPHILENAWGVWMPLPYEYWMWWPWVQNYHGESNFGHISTHLYRNYIWLDTELKASMGY
jgi:peptide/nickel transport system substrate-binding protein